MLGCGLGSALCFIDDLVSEQKCLIIPFIERDKNYETRTLQGKTFFMGIPMGKYPMGGEKKKKNSAHQNATIQAGRSASWLPSITQTGKLAYRKN